MNQEIINNMKKYENLSKYACKDSQAIRFKKTKKDIRTEFFRDIDKIIYSLSYIRYIDKTQVFSKEENDMISRRCLHVQLVSKIARTIGRALNLNEDLIEAASLGHDLGHTPLGHIGESILNEISQKQSQGYFNHNVQSVRLLMNIENHGKGSNLTVQVLDAILCHNGEILQGKYAPIKKTKEEFLKEYQESYKNKEILKNIKPMTLEGCIVRISDIIAYIGKDIDDAIRLNVIKKENIPTKIRAILGNTNSEIINTLTLDIIKNSYNKNYIKISPKIEKALNELIKFNYQNIYLKANTKNEIKQYKTMFNKLFNTYLHQLKNNQTKEDIYKVFLNEMNENYNKNTSNERKVLDFIAGMTDNYLINQYKKYKNKIPN